MPIWVLSYVWPGTLTGVLLGACIGYSGLMFFSVCWDTAIQNHVPHELLARVSSWDMLTSFVGMPLGQALAGFLTQFALADASNRIGHDLRRDIFDPVKILRPVVRANDFRLTRLRVSRLRRQRQRRAGIGVERSGLFRKHKNDKGFTIYE